jgi:hypothetical protein
MINKLLVVWRLGNPLNRKRTLTTRRQEESFSLDADVVNPIKVVMLGGETRAPARNITKKLDLRDDSRPHSVLCPRESDKSTERSICAPEALPSATRRARRGAPNYPVGNAIKSMGYAMSNLERLPGPRPA